jgi:ATP-dependent protease ClpP protease subunit
METKDILDEKNHVILLKGRITDELADKFLFALDKLVSKPVPVARGGFVPVPADDKTTMTRLVNIVIDSGGGLVDAEARIINALLAASKRPDCYITGLAIQAYSAAFTILQSCIFRTAIRSKKIVLYHHRMRHPTPGCSLRDFPKETFQAEKTRYEFIASRADKKLKEIYDLAKAKTGWTAEEALAQNFLDLVWDTPPPFLKGVFYWATERLIFYGSSRTRTCNLGFGDRCFTIETMDPGEGQNELCSFFPSDGFISSEAKIWTQKAPFYRRLLYYHNHFCLFLDFFMGFMSAAPAAKFLKLDFSSNKLLIFA